MRLHDLGPVSWTDSQLIYHAMPRVGYEGVNLLRPNAPYVCIGYHQDVQQEVDVAYCQAQGIPIFRREMGGGAVYLDGNQLFYQLVLHRDHPLARQGKERFYRQLLSPVAEAYCALGVEARYRPVNDVVTTGGRKISGTGAGEIGDYVILVGNLIADFDYDTMVRVLKVPDEKYRDKVYKSMYDNLSTLRRELGEIPSWEEMTATLRREFERVLGPLEPSPLPDAVRSEVQRLLPQFLSPEWLNKRGKRQPDRAVKIATGTEIRQRMFKAPGGLIRAIAEVKDGVLISAALSGDFFIFPQEKLAELEARLAGVPLAEVEAAITAFYEAEGIESPGVTPADFARVLAN